MSPAPAPADARTILVIKLGPLGDFIQALAAARLIRDYHFGARITLLTTEPFKTFAEKCPYFDVIQADGRPSEPRQVAQLIGRIRGAKYDMIYDLQNSGRTGNYFHGLKPWPPNWSGAAPGCSHPRGLEEGEAPHPLDALARQLEQAGLAPPGGFPPGAAPLPDLSWVRGALRDPPRLQPEYFGVKGRFILLVPGASPHWPEKRWPAERYAALAKQIVTRGVTPVVIGGPEEREIGAAVAKAEPKAKNIVSRSDLFQNCALAERAAAAIGEETGLMHAAAAAGCPCVVLFPAEADPDLIGPRGQAGVLNILAPDLADLPVADADRALGNLGAYPAPAHA